MKRFATSILSIGLVATTGIASAQSGYYPRDDREYDDQYAPRGDQDDRGYDAQPTVDRYGSGYGLEYDTARVIRVDPIIERGGAGYGYGGQSSAQPRCYTRQDGVYAGNGSYDHGRSGSGGSTYDNGSGYRSGSQAGRGVATVVGGIIGAALGSRVGGGNARYATAALGTLAGGAVGQQVYDNNNRYASSRSGSVTVCDPVTANAGYANNGGNDARVAGYDVTYEYAGRRYTTRTDYNPGDTIRVRVDVRAE